ncbi:MAG: xanthine dehydrogenase family protein molybdopterin-binding subunit, partial [Alphaproteobacteria bacterium]|nr:xanthine dehydrogenase family protein molybdopterin-binding subunit [Alphaproteobacteria bacterium]
EFASGTYRVTGTDRTLPLLVLAAKARAMGTLPAGLEPLDNAAKFVSPDFSFPNGCHICEVEIDRATGTLEVVGYTAVDDVGNVVSETIVDGQVHGGIAQGLGQVIGEHVIYDAAGQLVTGTFMDYQMPRAADLPAIRTAFHTVPCTTNPLGVKGAGESGVAGSLPSGHAAVLDALASAGAGYMDLPATPARIWAALNGAG